MRAILLICLIGAGTSMYEPIEASTDLERDAAALEIYLQDKKDHKEICPYIKWIQPALTTYKETLKSHLPKECKK